MRTQLLGEKVTSTLVLHSFISSNFLYKLRGVEEASHVKSEENKKNTTGHPNVITSTLHNVHSCWHKM